ncbi:hydroxymethylbilane synthase [Cerasicoccus arenae]|uniref:Hydroxymethylbilane synthase n=1 Tax=Cerasicoccus arenae TaxID=424488 RepID=A0A8J3DJ88_9BACT|nr:hydroxymethylbilane synthase [Cerasicoccus arenae]MBK1858749.1 hydroxymethylbilane synthase [Cerasicoccus arenae]GHC07274.1 porphobilinogen deaminase [Cerasicoccus arenae]
MSNQPIILATRRSPLALCQAKLAKAHVETIFDGATAELKEFVTTGDKKTSWSLEKEGGKGLFTKELEDALLAGEADLAVHSAKDLPTENPPGLAIAAFLPREAVNDVLVVRDGVAKPCFIATSSPRRRLQLKTYFPCAVWSEIRGNVDTRLRKIANGQADATILAAAGLRRLGILQSEGVVFKPLTIHQMVPAVGQGAIALQCRTEDVERFATLACPATQFAVELERKFLAAMGGGCHTATAGHFCHGSLHVFHEDTGRQEFPLPKDNGDMDNWLKDVVEQVLSA